MTDRFEDIVAGLDDVLHRAAQKELDHAEFHRQIAINDQHSSYWSHHSKVACDGDTDADDYDPCNKWEDSYNKFDALNNRHRLVGYDASGDSRQYYCMQCMRPLPASLDGYDGFKRMHLADGGVEDYE